MSIEMGFAALRSSTLYRASTNAYMCCCLYLSAVTSLREYLILRCLFILVVKRPSDWPVRLATMDHIFYGSHSMYVSRGLLPIDIVSGACTICRRAKEALPEYEFSRRFLALSVSLCLSLRVAASLRTFSRGGVWSNQTKSRMQLGPWNGRVLLRRL